MASEQAFTQIPNFPDDIEAALIPKISLTKLRSGVESELQAILDACQGTGFFFLDLRDDLVGESMTEEIDSILSLTHQTMELNVEEKLSFSRKPPHDLFGYKREGDTKTESGQPDRCEFYNLGRDDLLGYEGARAAPALLQRHRSLLKSYVLHGQEVIELIMGALSTQLQVPSDLLQDLQPADQPSGTMLRLIRYQPSIEQADVRTSLRGHTDFGTITLLANVLGGLQVLKTGHEPDDEHGWQWVRPEPRCLIVNMGDAMVEWTGGVLRSSMHRVNYSPGQQRFMERLSVALLVRPRRDAAMKRLVGGRIPRVEDDDAEGKGGFGIGAGDLTAHEWEVKRLFALRDGLDIAQSRGGRPLAPAVTA